MTSIVRNRLSDEFFDSVNRLHDAKLAGSLTNDELANLLILENKFFANLVSKGLRTEEDVEKYENDSDYSKTPIGTYNHENLPLAKNTIKQANTAALFDAETLNRRSEIQKGLRRVA